MPHSENLEVVNSGCNRDGHGDSESESVYTYYSVLSTQYSVLPPLQDRDCRNLKVTVMYDAVLSVFAKIDPVPEHHLNVHWQDSLPVQPSILELIIIQVICSGFLFYPVSPFPAPCYRSDLLSPVLSLTVVTHRIIGLPQ